jgi:hypothetical protein
LLKARGGWRQPAGSASTRQQGVGLTCLGPPHVSA